MYCKQVIKEPPPPPPPEPVSSAVSTFCVLYYICYYFFKSVHMLGKGCIVIRDSTEMISVTDLISDPVTNSTDWNWNWKRNVFMELKIFTYKDT